SRSPPRSSTTRCTSPSPPARSAGSCSRSRRASPPTCGWSPTVRSSSTSPWSGTARIRRSLASLGSWAPRSCGTAPPVRPPSRGPFGRVVLPLEVAGSTDLRVVADCGVLFDETVERDCEDPEEPRQPRVLGAQIVRDGSAGATALPRTGQDVAALAGVAGALLALGLAALTLAERRRTS